MKMLSPVAGCRLQVPRRSRVARTTFNFQPETCNHSPAFSLLEVLVVVSLLSLIVLALMAVFNSTQRAFRASVTQTDVLEGGRATMEMMAADLRAMAASGGTGNGAVNFSVSNNASYFQPLVQSLPGSTASRSSLLQQVFILNHENTKWWGVGYAVALNSSDGLYSLYRLQYPASPGTADPSTIFTDATVQNFFQNPTNGDSHISHILDGVVHFAVRAHDTSGIWITNGYSFWPTNALRQTLFSVLQGGEVGFVMHSNDLPASAELELGVLEDHTLQHAESLPTTALQTQYLSDKSGAVHLFHQRVSIPNVDPTAYQ